MFVPEVCSGTGFSYRYITLQNLLHGKSLTLFVNTLPSYGAELNNLLAPGGTRLIRYGGREGAEALLRLPESS